MRTLPQQFLITDTKTLEPVAAAEKLPKNSAIILRDYDLSFNKRLALGKKLKAICRRKNFIFLVAKDYKLALALKADGMHFPEFAVAEMRRIAAKKPDWIITAAVHSPRASKIAGENGADAVLISPIFPTKSHPDKRAIGIIRSKYYIYSGVAAYALGGVKPSSMKQLKMAGFCGYAGISWGKNCGVDATVNQSITIKPAIICH